MVRPSFFVHSPTHRLMVQGHLPWLELSGLGGISHYFSCIFRQSGYILNVLSTT